MEEIKLTDETRAIIEHHLEKKRIKWEQRHPQPIVREEPITETQQSEQINVMSASSNIKFTGFDIQRLVTLEMFVRSLRYQRSIMNVQDKEKENKETYETILRKELEEMKIMDAQILDGLGLKEAIENYLQRYN